MREIAIDTETTGLDPSDGHRIVEVACIELLHYVPSGRNFHRYVDPERDMPADAFAVHGHTAEFLAEHKRFAEIADELLAFIGDSPWSSTTPSSTLLFSMPSWRGSTGRRSTAGFSILWRWRDSAFRARRPASTRCADASRSISACAKSTAPISIAACWLWFISSCSAGVSRRSILRRAPTSPDGTRQAPRCVSRARHDRIGRPKRNWRRTRRCWRRLKSPLWLAAGSG